MELSDSHITALKLVVGIAATGASRHYFAKRQLWPWRISTLVAWPALGLGIMDLAIGVQGPKQASMRKVDALDPEEALKQRLARDAVRSHMQQIEARSTNAQGKGGGGGTA